jgi:hypothetical protein
LIASKLWAIKRYSLGFNMTYHSQDTVREFLKLCDWLFQSWQLRKYLFDENKDVAILKSPRHEHFFYSLQEIIQEHWLHQLAKLHDPAVQGSNINLSIDYIIDFGGWDDQLKLKLKSLREGMSILSTPVKSARNKLLSHNDLRVILEEKGPLGGFNQGDDEIYFSCLHEFFNLVSENALSQPFLYYNLVKNDVDAFISQFKRGET